MPYPIIFTTPGVRSFAEAVDAERQRQLAKWGEQNHPDGTGRPGDRENADRMRAICKANGPAEDNWRDILAEEVAEAFAETDRAAGDRTHPVCCGDPALDRQPAQPSPRVCGRHRGGGMSIALMIAALGLIGVSQLAVLAGRIKPVTFHALSAVGFGALAVISIGEGYYLAAWIHAALTAWHAHFWWHGGGGDGTKRRLRSLGRRFAPVRRTAPVGAA